MVQPGQWGHSQRPQSCLSVTAPRVLTPTVPCLISQAQRPVAVHLYIRTDKKNKSVVGLSMQETSPVYKASTYVLRSQE